MTICDLCYEAGKINDAPETCMECGADMCPDHGEGEYCLNCATRNAAEGQLVFAAVPAL
jgi:hypothetical protein